MKMIFVKMLTVCAAWGGDQKGMVAGNRAELRLPPAWCCICHLPRGAGDVWDAQSAVTEEVLHHVEITGTP